MRVDCEGEVGGDGGLVAGAESRVGVRCGGRIGMILLEIMRVPR